MALIHKMVQPGWSGRFISVAMGIIGIPVAGIQGVLKGSPEQDGGIHSEIRS